MTLIKAFYNAASGIRAQQSNLAVISDNISNVATVGYKTRTTNFENMVSGSDIVATSYNESGVKFTSEPLITTQGSLQGDSKQTALAISGKGFFAVTSAIDKKSGGIGSNASLYVTRAGDFSIDKDGFLVNTGGFYLLGSNPANISAIPNNLASLTPVRVPPLATGSPAATTSLSFSGNLPATNMIGTPPNTVQQIIYDSSGNAYNLALSFVKTAPNLWSINAATTSPSVGNTITATTSLTPVAVSFDTSGNLITPTQSVTPLIITLSSGETLSPSISFGPSVPGGGLTQTGGPAFIIEQKQDGSPLNYPTNISFDSNTGTFFQYYSNNNEKPIALIPLITYNNPNGLGAVSYNVWSETSESGTSTINMVNKNGAGKIENSSLESSTTDLAREFTDMIETQENHSVNARVYSIVNQMIQTASQIKT